MTEVLERRGVLPRETEIPQTAIPILISGLPGKMATMVAEAVARDGGFELMDYGMSSARHNHQRLQIDRENDVVLRDNWPFELTMGRTDLIAVDFTTPQSAELNAITYTKKNIPFVMGTTGGNRQAIEQMVRQSQTSAVIAPNMAMDVVALQDRLSMLAQASPQIFAGWQLTITESHQSTKRDISGTALAIQSQLESMGATLAHPIQSIRNPDVQKSLGIKNIGAHGYHWIALVSPTGEVQKFSTQIEGREPYVQGTLAAIKFLSQKIASGSRGEVYTMSDVIRDRREVEK